MTSRPHDALFKAAFEQPEHAGGLFRSILPADLSALIAWDTLTPEPGSFVDPELADSHSDMLFSAKLGDERALLYLLLEHQSTKDRWMPLRMLSSQVAIWKRCIKTDSDAPLPLIIPAIISHAPGGWTAPVRFEDLFVPHPSSLPSLVHLIPHFSLLLEDLTHVSDADLKSRTLAAFPKLALWLLRDGRNGDAVLENLAEWAFAFHEALRTPSGMEAVGQLFRYIQLVCRELDFRQFRAKIREQIPQA
ncbi:MAG TPA: Rpn family recombination-promoting nuclease/putative transposase, partial [Enhygromyxa sp.]|nr:Rpn family recombination-promoting nuclease/putative transposase [Enhygromyxa sp.]